MVRLGGSTHDPLRRRFRMLVSAKILPGESILQPVESQLEVAQPVSGGLGIQVSAPDLSI